jgi:mono/diheme cytochrome c family protein
MKSIYKILLMTVLVGIFTSCQKDSRPNYQFMPNMYEPVGYEAYGEYEVFPGEQEAMLPAQGTIARGMSVYDYENNEAGYQEAKAGLTNPLDSTSVDLERGKVLYDIYCGVCHGNKGDGNGILMKREKILGIPSYADAGRAITAGSIYHVMYYGRNTMGSYANQLNEEERWQVVAYVEKLKADLEK